MTSPSQHKGLDWDDSTAPTAGREVDVPPPSQARPRETGARQAGSDTPAGQTRVRSGHLVWSVPANGWVVDLPTWRAFTGQTRAAVRGWGWLAAVHARERADAAQAWEHALATQMPLATVFRIRRHDGVYRVFSVHGVPRTDARGRLRRWACSAVDVTARHESAFEPTGRQRRFQPDSPVAEQTHPPAPEQAARMEGDAAHDELRRLQLLTDTAAAHLRLDDLLPAMVERIHDVMHVDNVAILLMDAAEQTLTVRAARGPEEEVAASVRVPLGQGFAGRIAATRQPWVVDDLSRIAVANPFLRERLRSAVGVPLEVEGRMLGVVHVGTTQPHHFTAVDVLLLQQVAQRIALAIAFTRMYEAEQQARREAEAALARAQESERRFQRLVEANIIGLFIVEDERIVEANDAFLNLVGYTRDDLATGRLRWPDLTPPEYLAVSRRAVQEVLATGACTPFEKEYICKDGSRVPLLLGSVLLDRVPQRFVTFVLDLTERKRLEQERKEARANELAALEVEHNMDRFLALAAHDIRTPVTTGLGYTDLALRRFEQLAVAIRGRGDSQAELAANVLGTLENAKKSMDRLSSLTGLLFDVAHARSGTLQVSPEPCDLSALVREQVAALRVGTPSRTIQLDLPQDQSVHVLADANRISQVLANYVANALKYSTDDRPVEVRLELVGRAARVSVRDQGPGLPPEECERVWKPFHRAPGVEVQSRAGGPSGNLGLGLSICKTIVERHNGQVGVESVVGQGCTFWFALPLAEADDTGQPARAETYWPSQPGATT